MTGTLIAAPLTEQAFKPFGDVISLRDTPDMIINQGMCGRHHDLARVDIEGGRAGISLFDAEARHWPCEIALVERHPLGSQAFLPLDRTPFLVVVADDEAGQPAGLRAFVTAPGQGVNLLRGVWHGVLCPIGARGTYAVIDRVGDGENLEEHWFDSPISVEPVP